MCRTGSKLAVTNRKLTSREFVQIKMHYHYYRPTFDSFLKEIISHPRVKLAFYSSIMKKNIMPLLFRVFDLPTLHEYRSDIFEVFDQEYNVKDGRPSAKEYATVRSLKKVLDSSICKELGFTKKNTLMIDSEAVKILDDKENSIVIKPYESQDVIDNTENQQAILHEYLDYIRGLLDKVTDDVPAYISQHEPEYS